MKKALLAAVCFILVSFALVNGKHGLPDLAELFGPTATSDSVGSGKPVHVTLVTNNDPQMLFPGGAVTRTSTVLNEGEGNVCFRLAYAVQYDADSWPHLDISFIAAPGFEESDWRPITIDGAAYRMKVFTYTKALDPGESSPSVMITIAMDRTFTNEQMARFRSDFLQMKALAIDPTPFLKGNNTSITQVLDTALPLDTLAPF